MELRVTRNAEHNRLNRSARISIDGFEVISAVLSARECDAFIVCLKDSSGTSAGSRAMLGKTWCADLAETLMRQVALRSVLPVDPVAVQCTLFDKSPAKNWLVALHQDLSIPVAGRVDCPECSGWSSKEGHLYVKPPARVIEQLVAVRIHLDDCPADAGALRVVPGSHVFGRLDLPTIENLRTERGEVLVPVSRGGALLMRPLLLHASSKATVPQPRRVLHFVFGPAKLPLGLEWP